MKWIEATFQWDTNRKAVPFVFHRDAPIQAILAAFVARFRVISHHFLCTKFNLLKFISFHRLRIFNRFYFLHKKNSEKHVSIVAFPALSKAYSLLNSRGHRPFPDVFRRTLRQCRCSILWLTALLLLRLLHSAI